MHHSYVIDDPVALLAVPVLVIRGRDDRLSSADWERRLVAQAADGD